MSTNTGQQQQFFDSLENREYRSAFVAASIRTGLANQIRLLRESNGWTQAELAERIGKAQGTISLWENPDYGKYTLSTLREFAEVFDVALLVRFAPFSELSGWLADLTTQKLAAANYDAERAASMELPIQQNPIWEAAGTLVTDVGFVQEFYSGESSALSTQRDVVIQTNPVTGTFTVFEVKTRAESKKGEELLARAA